MPDSGAVYQPTTVGYTYDSGGDGTGGGGGLRHGFWRIMSRHKISTMKWIEWMLLSVTIVFFLAGLMTTVVNLVSSMSVSPRTMNASEVKPEVHTTMATDVQQHVDSMARGSIVVGATMMLIGVMLGCVCLCLFFFHRSKSSRNGMTGSSGQYGPVLTEVPSQLKMKQASSHDTPAVPLSDQEEETHTLMQDSASPPSVSIGSGTIASQIPG